MVNFTQIFPILYPINQTSNNRPRVRLSDTDTPQVRCANQIVAARPANVNLFRSLFYTACILTNPFTHLINRRLTSEQREKITQILVDKKLFEVPAVVNLRKKVKFYYIVNDILQKTYELNPSLDKKEFQNLSAKLEQYSIEVLQECMHEEVGLRYLEQLALNYVKLNVKKEWHTEDWWLTGAYKGMFLEKALPEVSQVKREQFEKLACAFEELGKKLCSQNDISVQIEAIQKSDSEERSIQALEKTIAIYKIARNAMLKMPGILEGLDFYRGL